MTFIYYLFACILYIKLGSTVLNCPLSCKCNNNYMKCDYVMPKFIPDSTSKVTIYQVQFGDRFDFSHPGWKNITHLSINPGDSVFLNKKEPFRKLHAYEFSHLENLEYLQLACSCLKEISRKTFYGLDKLSVLDLSNNGDLNISQIVKGLEGDAILPNIKQLYFSNTSVSDFIPFIIGRDFYDAVKNKPLKVLDLTHTEDTWFNKNDGLVNAFPNLEKLNISRAGIAVVSLGQFFHENPQTEVTSFQHLKILDVSYPTMLSKLSDLVFGSATHNILTFLPFRIEAIHAKRIFTSSIEIRGTSNETHACMFGATRGSPFQWCVVGKFPNLSTVDFSDNSIHYLDPKLIKYAFKKLKYFYISNNNLGHAFSQDNYVTSLMNVYQDLEVFIASSNAIAVMPKNTFLNNKNLRVIDLSRNRLDAIYFKLDHLIYLQFLDVQYNRIIYLESGAISMLRNLLIAQNSSTINSNSSDIKGNSSEGSPTEIATFKIALQYNPFSCNCKSIGFLNWLVDTNGTYSCTLASEITEITEPIIRRAEYMCKELYVIVILSLLSVSEMIIISVLMFCLIREARRNKLLKKTETGIELYNAGRENRKYVVFLSFCSEDESFVMNNVYSELDEGLKRVLKTEETCVATGATNFMPGFSIGDEIIRCIEASSVVLFFVTDTFCSKMWCRNEALVAHCERKPIVLMLWDNVNTKKMPKSLYKHYQKYTRIHWSVENGEWVMKPGWCDVCEAIIRLIGEDPLA